MKKFDPEFPLVLDVDGTLLANDLTYDLVIQGISRHPIKAVSYVLTGMKDKAAMKDGLVSLVGDAFDARYFPYNDSIIEIAQDHHSRGGQVNLCSGSHQTLINDIASQFDWVSEAFGTTKDVNLTKSKKADFLTQKYPDGFHYIGNSTQDFPVWDAAVSGAAINPPASLKGRTSSSGEPISVIEDNSPSLKTFLKAIRVHQWAKNGLIGLVPLLTFSSLTPKSILNVILGFFAMSFLASATYILNDLLDIPDDRQHASKKKRPLASGAMSVPYGINTMVMLSLLSLLCLVFLPTSFAYVLLIYLILTVSYSFVLKSFPIIDVITLSALFTIRVVAGATLVDQPISPWLLNFIASFFLSLAIVKRYTEVRKKQASEALPGRGYNKDDEAILLSLGIMAMGIALLSFLLYSILAVSPVIQSQPIRFLVVTVLTYWLMRVWFLAHRKELNDDPVLFAVKDRLSLVLGVFVVALVVIEQLGQL